MEDGRMAVVTVLACFVAAIYAAIVAVDTGEHLLWGLVVLNVAFMIAQLPRASKLLSEGTEGDPPTED